MAKANFWYSGTLDREFHNHTPSSVLRGLGVHGYAINHVAANGWRPKEIMPADINVIYGMRVNGRDIIEEYLKRGIPSIVIDLGYLKRAMKSNGYDGYWQVSLNGLNWLPDTAPDDRFKSLGLDYPKYQKRVGYVLLCEQTPGDSSHGMNLFQINDWMDRAVSKCEALGLQYKKRHHPMNSQVPKDQLPDCPIEDDLKGAACVYVHNSNAGNDALMAGLPVVCDENPLYKPAYYEIASKDLADIYYPENIQDYLNRLAYGQWTRDEIENGKAFEYVLAKM